MMFNSEGFAKPWLDFEKQVGKRLLFHGPEVANLFSQDEELSGLLLSKLTFPAPDASIKTKDKEISPGLRVRVYSPSNYAGDKPVCMHYHGGGWAMGSIDRDDPQIRKIAKDVGVIVVSVEYRLAPANPYPAGLDDCVTAYHWALENAKFLNTTANQVITCGGSAGGNLALSTALKIIDQGLGDTLKGVVAIVPVTIAPDAVPEKYKAMYLSYEEHAEHTINTASAMKAFFSAYGADGSDPYVSPLLHPRLKDLPRVYIAVAGQDTLRDDGRLLKLALDEAGVMNQYDEYKGYPHWFWAFPSEYLAETFAQYNSNVTKGFQFILSSSS